MSGITRLSAAARGSILTGQGGQKRVLNAGSGPYSPHKLHRAFRGEEWGELRLDIDPTTKPDLVGSVVDLAKVVAPASVDAIWCSHNLEHLDTHEVRPALEQFRRALKPDGFALITSPDLEAVAQLILDGRLDDVAYTSPAGPITALDMLFGHSASVARGNTYMRHQTGFTQDLLGRLLVECGFKEAWVAKGRAFDVWAAALMPGADREQIRTVLRGSELDGPQCRVCTSWSGEPVRSL